MTSAHDARPPAGRFAILPVSILGVKLRLDALRLLIALAGYANRDGMAWPALSTLARDLGWHAGDGRPDRPRVTHTMDELVGAGVVVRCGRQRGRSALYRVTFVAPGLSTELPHGAIPDGAGCCPTGQLGVAPRGNRTDHEQTSELNSLDTHARLTPAQRRELMREAMGAERYEALSPAGARFGWSPVGGVTRGY